LTDKQESRVEKRLKQWEQQLGFAPTPQLREQARTQLALQELEQLDGERPARSHLSRLTQDKGSQQETV